MVSNQSTKKKARIRRNSLLFISGILIGALAGFIQAIREFEQLPAFLTMENLLIALRCVEVGLLIVTAYVIYRLLAYQKAFQSCSEDNEDEYERLYNHSHRQLGYLSILVNVLASLTVVCLLLGNDIQAKKVGISFFFSFFEIGMLLVMIGLQFIFVKLNNLVRHYKLSLFATDEDMVDYLNSLDEGERQAYYVNSHQIVFNLNFSILPLLYVLVFAVSAATGQAQVLGYLLVAIVHIYINLLQVKSVQDYYR
ncbi:DUF3169 family protein [Streptococcus suis]|uniref:DUF3169 family protein n=1 Tax=Streptococcus suis TaxID=1307 RepID=UPI001ABE8DFC|nr:DUF3169 family protein [Streptococcus suis]